MSSIKETLSNLVSKQQTNTSGPGEFPKPDEFTAETQRGSVVGKETELKSIKPLFTEQESTNGFTEYKAANKLADKKALVTGGDSGIGRAAAVMFALEGADVAIVYLPEEHEDAVATKRHVEKAGRVCLLIPQDIRDEQGAINAVKQVVTQFGRIDILVNNASVMYDVPDITNLTTEQFDRTMKTNIYGTFFITRAAIPHIPKGGSIITTASQVAYSGPPSLVDYAMTKGAQVAFTRSLSNQLLSKGIRVNAVCPGPVWTALQPAAMDKEKMGEWHQSPAPIGRVGQPSELGPAFVFLASKDASFISGQSIHVNGGTIVSG